MKAKDVKKLRYAEIIRDTRDEKGSLALCKLAVRDVKSGSTVASRFEYVNPKYAYSKQEKQEAALTYKHALQSAKAFAQKRGGAAEVVSACDYEGTRKARIVLSCSENRCLPGKAQTIKGLNKKRGLKR